MRISIEHLSKMYPNRTHALNDLTLSIESGMFGLLGPNGAGKTTLMRILATLLEPTSGTVSIGCYNLRKNRAEIRALIGYLPQELEVFPKLKTREFLDYNARLAGLMNYAERKRVVNELLERVRLSEERDRLCNDHSGGMKRRLGIAQALIGSPRLLVVDEPTAGLDPEERLRFRSLLSELGDGDVTIILSTHIVGDISSSCGDMAMLHRGEIVYCGAPQGLLEKARGHTWAGTGKEHVRWETLLPKTGMYTVYYNNRYFWNKFYYGNDASITNDFHFRIHHAGGVAEKVLTDRGDYGWALLGEYRFDKGPVWVELSDKTTGKIVYADAVKWVKK